MQRPAQKSVVAKLGIAQHGGDLKAGRPHLPQQRQGQAPLFLKAHRGRDLGPLSRVRGQPGFGQIQRRAEHPRAYAGPQRRGHRHLAVGDLA
jgi:hypothetical protein